MQILMSVMKEVTHAKLVLRNVSTHREATHVGQNHVQLEEKGILQTLDVALVSISRVLNTSVDTVIVYECFQQKHFIVFSYFSFKLNRNNMRSVLEIQDV